MTIVGSSDNLSGSKASPGGEDTEVQFNDGGEFGGDSEFTYNKGTDTLDAKNITEDGVPVATTDLLQPFSRIDNTGQVVSSGATVIIEFKDGGIPNSSGFYTYNDFDKRVDFQKVGLYFVSLQSRTNDLDATIHIQHFCLEFVDDVDIGEILGSGSGGVFALSSSFFFNVTESDLVSNGIGIQAKWHVESSASSQTLNQAVIQIIRVGDAITE